MARQANGNETNLFTTLVSLNWPPPVNIQNGCLDDTVKSAARSEFPALLPNRQYLYEI